MADRTPDSMRGWLAGWLPEWLALRVPDLITDRMPEWRSGPLAGWPPDAEWRSGPLADAERIAGLLLDRIEARR